MTPWLTVGDEVVVARAIGETERALLGARGRIARFSAPHGYAVLATPDGERHVHPEACDRVSSNLASFTPTDWERWREHHDADAFNAKLDATHPPTSAGGVTYVFDRAESIRRLEITYKQEG